jgi:hypothetical protein
MVVGLPVLRVALKVPVIYDQNSFLADRVMTTIVLPAEAEGMMQPTTHLNRSARVDTRTTHRTAIVSVTENVKWTAEA